ncbi:lactoylglutathione lyase [Sporodiniella umbellata]|nr:lactoylglutathione lyase [Sporodiniella umbellata]
MPTDPTKYKFNHTSVRIKEPERSLKFYTEVIGMKHIFTYYYEPEKTNLYFLAFIDNVPEDEEEIKKLIFSSSGILELTHLLGIENQPDFAYKNGNTEESLGYGHIALVVDNLEEACERFESLGVKFEKRLEDGDINELAFISDPDGYWVEVLQNPIFTGRNSI